MPLHGEWFSAKMTSSLQKMDGHILDIVLF